MELVLETEKHVWRVGETVTVRLLVLNNSYTPAAVDRRLLVGPNPVPDSPRGAPFPVSVEPSLPKKRENRVVLNPWCFYGRQRTFKSLPPGRVTFFAYLLQRAVSGLTPQGPTKEEALLVAADSLVLTIEEAT